MVSVKGSRNANTPWTNSRKGQYGLHTNQQRQQHLLSKKIVTALLIVFFIRSVFYFQYEVFSNIDIEVQEHQERQKSRPEKGRSSIHNGGLAQKSEDEEGSSEDKTSDEARNSEDTEDSAEAKSSGGNTGKSDEENKGSSSGDEEVSAEAKSSGENLRSSEANRSSEDKRSSEERRSSGDRRSSEDMYFRDPKAPVTDWNYYPPLKHEPRRDPLWTQAVNSKPAYNLEECDAFMKGIDMSPPPKRKPSNKACEGYDGVLQIHHYDWGGASGTCFFLFTVGMMAWADQHNYIPWVYIDDDQTKPIWDPIVHTNPANAVEFEMMGGTDIEWARDPDDPAWHIFPGKPFQKKKARKKTFATHGTGVWEHYFLPVNDFVPGDESCRKKPLLRMNDDLIVPGIHAHAPWAPRAWRYTGAQYIVRSDLSWDKWFKPQRQRGAQMVDRYIRLNPMMERRAYCSFPNQEFSLGLHIRHGDKYIEREVIKTDRFYSFAKAFVKAGGGSIYVATDSAKVIKTIMTKWPKYVAEHVVYQPSVEGRTTNQTAAFDIGVSSHRTNVEALTDILALSKCTFFLHGLSAMSEAVLYLNPGLVERSVNLEDEFYKWLGPKDFVKRIMPLGKKESRRQKLLQNSTNTTSIHF